ncbi:hypothetical protein LguiA_022276 [Lonicera macranthoides]
MIVKKANSKPINIFDDIVPRVMPFLYRTINIVLPFLHQAINIYETFTSDVISHTPLRSRYEEGKEIFERQTELDELVGQASQLLLNFNNKELAMAHNHSGACSNNPGGEDVEYFIPPRSISSREIFEKIYQLQLELADRTFELEGACNKLDKALIDGAYVAREIAKLRAALDSARRFHQR